jgi:hypothetical protein
MSDDPRWKAVRAHVAKGDKAKDKAEQHYIAAGQYLAALKAEHTGTWAEWEAKCKERAGIGKSRASELMAIADGRKTIEQVRERSNESSATSHAKARKLSHSPLISGESADSPQASAEARKAEFAALDAPASSAATAAAAAAATSPRSTATSTTAASNGAATSARRLTRRERQEIMRGEFNRVGRRLVEVNPDVAREVRVLLWIYPDRGFDLVGAIDRAMGIDEDSYEDDDDDDDDDATDLRAGGTR